MGISDDFANAIYYARMEQDKTQQQVADEAEISVQWYQRLEKGGVSAAFPTCVKVAKVLNVDLNQFTKKELKSC